jgi:hypothetical protein
MTDRDAMSDEGKAYLLGKSACVGTWNMGKIHFSGPGESRCIWAKREKFGPIVNIPQ